MVLQAFPFDPNPNWKKFYSDGDEILEYMERICDKWNLRRDIQFNTKVVAADWQDDEGKWKLVVEKDGQRRDEYADIVLNATGFLR
jgi:cation diffusion facilitator CzcD-associated flavoprotein CzcO